jgi:Formate hydrogenlyase subunit 6/NADH:ubiquinone oxidoreductase 23 kD subunit (chain I)
MDTEIYYFSGTGNSLAVAREIAKKTGAKLISISSVINADRIQAHAETVGIVFPSYLAGLSGLPLIVERFVKKITHIEVKRIFAVCTCGGYESVNALPALNKLNRVIRACGGALWAEYSVRLPMNNLDYRHIPVPIEKDSGVIIGRSKKRIAGICDSILKNKSTRFKYLKILFLFLMKPLFNMMKKPVIDDLRVRAKEPKDSPMGFSELVSLTDKNIVVNEKCTGCGICAKVCPAGNIRMIDAKPQWQHRCEMCFACDEWCPCGAIRHWSRAAGIKYHYPDIKLSDMMVNNGEF